MDKLTKLEEINTKLNKIIGDLETYVFIKKINIPDNKFIMDYNRSVSNLK